jgi:hypothetical protein
LVRRHVVEQDGVHAASEHLWNLIEAVDFHLDANRMGNAIAEQPERLGGADPLVAQRHQMIVLDEHAIREIEAMVAAAADAHRISLEQAQAGRRFPGVDDVGRQVADLLHEAGGCRGDGRHALDKVQRHALSLQDGAGRATNHRRDPARLDPLAVGDQDIHRDSLVNRAEHRGQDLRAAHDPSRAIGHRGTRRCVVRDQVISRDISPTEVLGERSVHDAPHLGGREAQRLQRGEFRLLLRHRYRPPSGKWVLRA